MAWRVIPLFAILLGSRASWSPRIRRLSTFNPSFCRNLSAKRRDESENDEPFQYETLPSPTQWIRLLRIEPSPRASDPIICLLEDRRLADGGEDYEALSYVWGDDPAECNISINARPAFHSDQTEQIWAHI
ncbi:hypothetical protein B0T26DRAFT_192517 [Lasiosphaeria miniovina]|uniref:Heterokaryon incompatibility domain-containing protein n=1 Tax=Lasiosphaeria miniovina TaxID=1954250 RepID=A0AA40ATN6_9PEZI|nr:uncharacterized protein B0T26DRAFT_192517 [Lasiosphaeria miniovina]KAK0721766.1 hypothetical protein B0T26DRAFT_192517 [Lasiosphaeria miniovina]